MAEKLLKSLFYLTSFTGAGYILWLVCAPDGNVNKFENLPGREKSPREIEKKKRQFADVLEAATKSNKPFYRLDKDEIEKEIKRN